MKKKIVFIIPTYNEEKNIEKLTKKIRSFFPSATIFVIDDSPHLKIKKILLRKKNIKYYKRSGKRGRGSAVIYGFKKSLKFQNYNIFIEMDADFSHNPIELKSNVKYFLKNKLDLLIASRYLPKSKIINWSLSRRILSFLSNKLARFLLEINVTDYTNGFRIYSNRSVKKITQQCGKIGDGFIVLSEILLKINNLKYIIDELPTKFVNRVRGESSVNFKLVIQSLMGLIKLYFIKLNLKN